MVYSNKLKSIDNDVDVATKIFGLARYSDDFIRSAGHSMSFAKDLIDSADRNQLVVRTPKKAAGDNYNAEVEPLVVNINPNYNVGFAARKQMLNARGQFLYVILLSHIFGFCRHVRKDIFGASHNVVLLRTTLEGVGGKMSS